MTLLPLDIPPGFVKVDSPNGAKGRFTDGDKVRFDKGKPEKWSGWVRFLSTVLNGAPRGAVSWTNVFGNTNVSFGTHLKLYAIASGDVLSDITPIRSTGTLSADPFATTDGSDVVVVSHTSHGAGEGDFVTFGGATAVGGITINGEYQILQSLGANSYTIQHSSDATSTSAGGGGSSVTFSYEINTGNSGSVVGLGWGAGLWGDGNWGDERDEGISLELRHWSLEEYGNDLLASPSGGGLYLWEEDSDTEAEVVTNAPTEIRAMFVSGERFIFALGTTTPMTVDWPDQDDITDWTPTTSNTANTRVLQSGSKLISGVKLVDTINLVWSDTSLYVFQYIGSSLVYDSRLAGTNCGLIGPLAHATVSGAAYWMSGRDFHMFSGSVQAIPNSQDVSDFVYKDMDPNQTSKVWCIYDEGNDQVRWGYCSAGSEEPDKYVDVSLQDYSWTTGTLDRTCGTRYRPGDASLLMADSNGVIYEHNVGTDAETSALESSITFGLYAISRGEKNVDVMGVIPDCERQTGDLTFRVFTKERPNSALNLDEDSAVLSASEEIADIRVEGRHFSMEVSSNVVGGDYRLGITNLEIQPSGDRR